MKHYIKVYWDDDLQEFKDKLQENFFTEDIDEEWTYAEEISDKFGGDGTKLPIMIISGKCFFILGAGTIEFDELILGDPDDEGTWINLHDVEFQDSSTSFEIISKIAEDSGDFIPVYLGSIKDLEDGYKLLEVEL